MNANEIWSGNDYAHTDNISRGVAYYEHASRVKALRVFKEQPGQYSYKERATTMVEVLVLNANTGEPLQRGGEDYTRTVRARDIFMRWDEYKVEKERRERDRELIATQAAREQEMEEAAKTRILECLENKGINRLMVNSITPYVVSFNRRQLEEWLGV